MAVLAIAAWTALVSIRAQAAVSDATPWPTDELIALTNVDRTSNGLPALLIDERLMQVAQNRSDDMLARGYFAHEIPPDGHTVWDVLGTIGLRGIWGGENLHRNNLPRAQSVSFAERALMQSPDHRANILERNFDSLGVGVAYDELSGRSIYTIVFGRVGPAGTQPEPAAPALAGSSTRTSHRPAPAGGGAPRGLVDDIVQRTLRQELGL